MRFLQFFFALLVGAWLGPVGSVAAQSNSGASGRGSYFVLPDTIAVFEFDQSHVQCKVPRTVLADGTEFFMLMVSTDIESVTIDSAGKTIVMTGKTMTSLTQLNFPDGSSATLAESVPFVVKAKDNHDTTGAGNDSFSLSVNYNPDEPGPNGLNQYKVFKASAANPVTTFGGDLVAGAINLPQNKGQAQFFFAVNSGGGNTADRINLNGAGDFGVGMVTGGGTFTRVTPTGTAPFPIVSSGTWRATRFVSFTETPGSPYGQIISGILTIEVELRPRGDVPVAATMAVICNSPGGGLLTGEDEGVKLTLTDGTTFVPIGQGQTILGPGILEDN
jgi:hypothetical protein